MSVISAPLPQAAPRALQGIGCVLLGMVLFVFQDGMMKSLLQSHTVWVLLFARSAMAVCILTPLIWILGAPHRLLTPLWPLHLARAALFVFGFAAFYAAFPFMGLAEVSTIFYSAPLITALLAALWLGETLGPHRIGALIVGFCGVLIAMNPAGATFQWVAVLPLLCAFSYAIAQILARKIGDRETTLTVGLHSLGFAGLMVLPLGWALNQIIPFGPEVAHLQWALPERPDSGMVWIVLLALFGMGGYMLVSRAYQVTNASLVAPFDYTFLPLATLMAWLVWDEVPNGATLCGMALIILSGLYLGYRELRAARYSDDTPVTAETTFVPGAATPAAAHADEGPAA